MRQLRLFLTCCRGATAVEYGLIMALIAVVIIAGASAAGTAIGGKFMYVSQQWYFATGGSAS